MWTWVIVVLGYAVPTVILRLLGGVNAAGDAFSRWGNATAKEAIRRRGLDGVLRGVRGRGARRR